MSDNAYIDPVWERVKHVVKVDKGYRGVYVMEDEGELARLRYALGDGSGRAVDMNVSYDCDTRNLQVRAIYRFRIDPRALPVAEAYICARNYRTLWTRIELDASDGEVYVNIVCPLDDREHVPARFGDFLLLAASEAFEHFDTFERLSRCELADAEVSQLLDRLGALAPLIDPSSEA